MSTDTTADLRVSVALATHNGEQFVADQVRSILAQTLEPFEIVLGDDASDDATVAIVEELVAEHRAAGGRTELVVRRHRPALGLRDNIADALSAARGDLIALSDQDDVWHPTKLARVVPAFAADSSLLLVHTDAHLVDAEGVAWGERLLDALEASDGERARLRSGDAWPVLLRRNLVTGATVVIRRELVARAEPFASEWVHDEWLAVLAAATGGVRLIEDALIDYRQHGANQIGARRLSGREKWARLAEPREPRASTRVARSLALAERVEALVAAGAPVVPSALHDARSRYRHDVWRRDLPAARIARIPVVLAAAVLGHYGRYARGAIDVARDLAHPGRVRKESR